LTGHRRPLASDRTLTYGTADVAATRCPIIECCNRCCHLGLQTYCSCFSGV